MILDTSAIIAILFREAGAGALLERLWSATVRAVGAPTLVEAGVVLTARAGEAAVPLLHHFLDAFSIATVPFDGRHAQEAVAIYNTFGKGHHPAGLNYGDCLSMATARLAGLPLLCVGDDFSRTDVELA
ncbi:MAG: type II toxin-antitoxin system VapC family toxin [Ardenticatenales bacterium]|nr:type II toxin-antitoxin system VapC family toxin [Ardenticatenales bacterium]